MKLNDDIKWQLKFLSLVLSQQVKNVLTSISYRMWRQHVVHVVILNIEVLNLIVSAEFCCVQPLKTSVGFHILPTIKTRRYERYVCTCCRPGHVLGHHEKFASNNTFNTTKIMQTGNFTLTEQYLEMQKIFTLSSQIT